MLVLQINARNITSRCLSDLNLPVILLTGFHAKVYRSDTNSHVGLLTLAVMLVDPACCPVRGSKTAFKTAGRVTARVAFKTWLAQWLCCGPRRGPLHLQRPIVSTCWSLCIVLFFRLSEFFHPLLGRTRFRGRCWAAIPLSHRPESSAVQSVRRSMDCTLEDNMVDGLFFCATLTGRRGGHTPFVQAGAETSDTGAEAVESDPGSSWEGHSGRGGYRCLELKCGVLWGCPPTAPHVCCCCQKKWNLNCTIWSKL